MKGDSEFIITLTVLETMTTLNGSNIRDITNAYARNCDISKTAAAARVRMGIARGKSTGYIHESPRGIYTLNGFDSVGCDTCDNAGKTMAARRRKGKGGKMKSKGKGRKKVTVHGIVKKRKGVKRITKK